MRLVPRRQQSRRPSNASLSKPTEKLRPTTPPRVASLGNKLQALAWLSPAHLGIIENLVDLMLARLHDRPRWSLLVVALPTFLAS